MATGTVAVPGLAPRWIKRGGLSWAVAAVAIVAAFVFAVLYFRGPVTPEAHTMRFFVVPPEKAIVVGGGQHISPDGQRLVFVATGADGKRHSECGRGEQCLTEQDKKIADTIVQQRRACIVVINKWDLFDKDIREAREEEIARDHIGGHGKAPAATVPSQPTAAQAVSPVPTKAPAAPTKAAPTATPARTSP